MAANWMRRTVLSSVAAASVALLAACGSSSVANSIKPDSLVTFGDALSDLGQNPNGRPYSVTTTTTACNQRGNPRQNRYSEYFFHFLTLLIKYIIAICLILNRRY